MLIGHAKHNFSGIRILFFEKEENRPANFQSNRENNQKVTANYFVNHVEVSCL